MARATFAIAVAWTALMILTAMVIDVVQANVGVNWGTMASHPLNPHIVVNLLKDNGIKKVKLFDSDSWTVSALAGSKIETIVAIPNDQLESFASDYNLAKDWVKENITTHIYEGGVDIRSFFFFSSGYYEYLRLHLLGYQRMMQYVHRKDMHRLKT